MTRSIDEVKRVTLPWNANILCFDRDASLALEIHRVQILGAHISRLHSARHLQNSVGKGRLTVVDVGDDREIADCCEIH